MKKLNIWSHRQLRKREFAIRSKKQGEKIYTENAMYLVFSKIDFSGRAGLLLGLGGGGFRHCCECGLG